MNFKKVTFFFSSITALLGATLPLFAQETGYTPLAPLPGITTDTVNLTTYLQELFNLSITLAGVLAVLVIVIGGIQYMMSEAIGDKSAATKRIWSAVLGLLLVISSWLILNTINPDLIKLDIFSNATSTERVSAPRGGIVNIPLGAYCFKWKDNASNPSTVAPCVISTGNDCRLTDGYIRNCEASSLTACRVATGNKILRGFEIKDRLGPNECVIAEEESTTQQRYCFGFDTQEEGHKFLCYPLLTTCQSNHKGVYDLSTQEIGECSEEDDNTYKLDLVLGGEDIPIEYPTETQCEAGRTVFQELKNTKSNVDTSCKLEQ